jgi:hypothetical protein
MEDRDQNPYAPPTHGHVAPDHLHWTKLIPTKILLWAAAFFVLMVASIVAGSLHYNHLAAGYDVRIRDSRVLAEITEPAKYWLIPAPACLAIWLVLSVAAIVLFAIRLMREL